MMNQNTPNDMMRIAATGTTIAGIKVSRLFDEDDVAAAVEVPDVTEEVFAEEAVASVLGVV